MPDKKVMDEFKDYLGKKVTKLEKVIREFYRDNPNELESIEQYIEQLPSTKNRIEYLRAVNDFRTKFKMPSMTFTTELKTNEALYSDKVRGRVI